MRYRSITIREHATGRKHQLSSDAEYEGFRVVGIMRMRVPPELIKGRSKAEIAGTYCVVVQSATERFYVMNVHTAPEGCDLVPQPLRHLTKRSNAAEFHEPLN